jgi:hypothetical protein
MVPYLILGIAILTGVILTGKWLASAEPKQIIKAFKIVGIGVLVVLVMFFAATGRLLWIFYLLPVLIPWLLRFRAAARMAKNFSRMSKGGSTGQTSDVETKYLRLSLDHDSGDMAGEVLIGDYAGQRIEEMELSDLIELTAECVAQDEQSAQILEAYLDRMYPEWRDQVDAESEGESRHEHGRGWGPKSQDGMSQNEAYEVLGLLPGATEKEIKEAYHRLISNLHPDHGGSTYLAAKINQAKDTLLQHI